MEQWADHTDVNSEEQAATLDEVVMLARALRAKLAELTTTTGCRAIMVPVSKVDRRLATKLPLFYGVLGAIGITASLRQGRRSDFHELRVDEHDR